MPGFAPPSCARRCSGRSLAWSACWPIPLCCRSCRPACCIKGRKALRIAGRLRQKIQTLCYAWERQPEAFVDDVDCPYTTPPDKPFHWIRARGIGGRVTIPGHGRQYLRFGRDDFAPQDGKTPDWPFAPGALDPWYALVETRLGLSGARDGLDFLPDSEIASPLSPSAAEAALIARIKTSWPGSHPVMGRYAPPADTLTKASETGKLAIRQGAIVRRIDVENGHATGVTWHDRTHGKDRSAKAPLIFLCASALESTRILMLSKDDVTGQAIGARSDALGRYLMDHVMLKAEGIGKELAGDGPVKVEDGRCVYLPRFDARDEPVPKPGRGFGVQVYEASIGNNRSFFTAVAFSEMLPRAENRVTLDPARPDRWGIPALHIDCAYGAEELMRARDQSAALKSLADIAGVTLTRLDTMPPPPGMAVHECGTARMGTDPENSVLDPDNQCWDARGLYVTDSACFPSQGSQNPTLTVMALTARACDHAIRQFPSPSGRGLRSLCGTH